MNSHWCDDPNSANYNRPVEGPLAARHEQLWRDDDLYDELFALDYNLSLRKKDAGSAIFFHIARTDFGPTEGCVAIRKDDMRRLIPRLARHVIMEIR
jgi:L,D-peptidoglycan transpeptidase YkuD (ErfK/YbiS/YcfS/YnhG family)